MRLKDISNFSYSYVFNGGSHVDSTIDFMYAVHNYKGNPPTRGLRLTL